jgi:putative membrane protein
VDNENIFPTMTENADNVSRIHKRYSLTTLTPSSHYLSLLISIIVTSATVALALFAYFKTSDKIFFSLPLSIAVLYGTQILDARLLKTEFSKIVHLSAFGNLLWFVTLLGGFASAHVFSKPELLPIYITEGMFLFASFRIGLFTSVMGAKLKTAWAVCLIQPLAMFFAFVPSESWIPMLSDLKVIEYGLVFLFLATAWTLLSDRAAGIKVPRTHKVLQAYVAAWTRNDPSEMETLMEERSQPTKVSTFQILFKTKNNECRLVVPDVHPGPFHPIGGSNIPYLIYKNLNYSAMVMHSVSDHSLNLPSKSQVDAYLSSLTKSSIIHKGFDCTKPVTVQVNKARAVGLLFGKTAVLILSLSPHGMEDVPLYVKSELEQYGKNRGFEKILIVDSHNAMGEEILKQDSDDLLKAAKSNLDTLITKEAYPLEIGYANSENLKIQADDLGPGKVGVMCLKINNEKFFLGWADSNNMRNGLREEIVASLSKSGYNLLDICTSDSHYKAREARNKYGYFYFGSLSESQEVASWYLNLVKKAEQNLSPAMFETLQQETDVKVMGPKQLENYSKSLDRAMKITQGFLIGTTAFFLFTLL